MSHPAPLLDRTYHAQGSRDSVRVVGYDAGAVFWRLPGDHHVQVSTREAFWRWARPNPSEGSTLSPNRGPGPEVVMSGEGMT